MINSKEYKEITNGEYVKKLENENHYLKKVIQQKVKEHNNDIIEICGSLITLFLTAYLLVYFCG